MAGGRYILTLDNLNVVVSGLDGHFLRTALLVKLQICRCDFQYSSPLGDTDTVFLDDVTIPVATYSRNFSLADIDIIRQRIAVKEQ